LKGLGFEKSVLYIRAHANTCIAQKNIKFFVLLHTAFEGTCSIIDKKMRTEIFLSSQGQTCSGSSSAEFPWMT
jgi:hypothetical protein